MRRIAAIIAAVFLSVAVWAQEIRDIDILVELGQDGSAWITQNWDVTVVDGTEWYIPVENLGPMTVEDLSVTEGGESFQSLGDSWDVDESRRWKAGKCGIVRKRDGVELCWGLGEYGPHKWTTRYRVTGLVQAYDDADGFNFMFVNPGLVARPKHAKVTIVPAFDMPEWTYDNTRVWAFGFYGEINVRDGKVIAESSEEFSRSSKLIALVKFEKGMFCPAVEKGGPFQNLLDKALEGSEYGQDDGMPAAFAVIMLLLFGGGILFMIWAVVAAALGYKYNKSIYGRSKITGWYRDIPLEKNLFAAYYTLLKGAMLGFGTSANNLIGAFFLRWIMEGKVKPEKDPKSDKRMNLKFLEETISAASEEQDLYDMARLASGDNLLLEKNEFEKWSTKNYKKVTAWPDRAMKAGKAWYRDKGYFLRPDKTTETGAKEATHLIEFKNFLKDFTLSGERGSGEVSLWKDYLVYAQLFGIADKVAKQFEKLYPGAFDELAKETGMDSHTFIYTINWANSMSTKAFMNAVNRAGSVSGTGGHSSFGGGGGFSGGGFGGGSR